MEGISITSGYIPGLIGRITELHATYYSKKSGFGLFFEAKVAREITDFLHGYNEERDGIWLAMSSNTIIGSVIIDGKNATDEGAHLRWFIVSPENQNKGIGGKLIDKAIQFCKTKGYQKIFLWTFEGLEQARHLYDKKGFMLYEQNEGEQWGVKVLEQKFQLILKK